jgi:16S rRNA (uracil1498-N3)-methyltransferase
MRSHRAFVNTLEPVVKLTGSEAAHLRVLRAGIGDSITLFDGAGLEADAKILTLEDFTITLEVGKSRVVNLEPPQEITLAIALLKGDKLAEVVRAATELGVSRVQLLITEHSDLKEIGDQKLERLQRVALEASKQCRRAVTPFVLSPIKLKNLEPVTCGLVAHPGSSLKPRDGVNWDVPIMIATGPEGGFSSSEIQWLEAKGFVRVGLGPRILRAETAPIAILGALTAGEGH